MRFEIESILKEKLGKEKTLLRRDLLYCIDCVEVEYTPLTCTVSRINYGLIEVKVTIVVILIKVKVAEMHCAR